jgi:hypothetical protein
MTYLWLFAHTSLMQTGDDYGDLGLEVVSRHNIGSRSNQVLAIQWEISLYPEKTIRA